MASILKGQSGQPLQFTVKPNVNGDDVLTRPEIVGTVSQLSGVPTGAIIQRGSNANGEFVRYADGTQICTMVRTVVYSQAIALASLGNSFPISFNQSPSLTATVRSTIKAGMRNASIWCPPPTLINFSVELLGDVGGFVSGDTADITLVAIGRWF